MKTTPNLRHLTTLQMAAGDALRTGGPLARAVRDLLENGNDAAADSVHEVLSLLGEVVPNGLTARVQTAAADLGEAVRRAHQAFPYALDQCSLVLAHQTTQRVTAHLVTDDEWQALARGVGEPAPDLVPPHLALIQHGGVLAAVDPHAREIVNRADHVMTQVVGCRIAGAYAPPEPALVRRDLAYHDVPDLDLRLGLVLLGRAQRLTTDDLMDWYLEHRPMVPLHGVHMAGALQVLGEDSLRCSERVHALLTEALRASGAVLSFLAVSFRLSVVASLATELTGTAHELTASGGENL